MDEDLAEVTAETIERIFNGLDHEDQDDREANLREARDRLN